jgi:hypothetical protein
MTASTSDLAELKRKLLLQYEEEIARLTTPAPTPASADENDVSGPVNAATMHPFPTVSSLSLQLLCLRKGRTLHDIPTTARGQIVMMAYAMSTPDVVVEERLRRAQEESVRLLVQRTTAVMTPRGAKCDDPRGAAAATAAPVSITATERLQLLEKMYATNIDALADVAQSEAQGAQS